MVLYDLPFDDILLPAQRRPVMGILDHVWLGVVAVFTEAPGREPFRAADFDHRGHGGARLSRRDRGWRGAGPSAGRSPWRSRCRSLITIFGFNPDALPPGAGLHDRHHEGPRRWAARCRRSCSTRRERRISLMTTLDGFPMTKKGEAGKALRVAHFFLGVGRYLLRSRPVHLRAVPRDRGRGLSRFPGKGGADRPVARLHLGGGRRFGVEGPALGAVRHVLRLYRHRGGPPPPSFLRQRCAGQRPAAHRRRSRRTDSRRGSSRPLEDMWREKARANPMRSRRRRKAATTGCASGTSGASRPSSACRPSSAPRSALCPAFGSTLAGDARPCDRPQAAQGRCAVRRRRARRSRGDGGGQQRGLGRQPSSRCCRSGFPGNVAAVFIILATETISGVQSPGPGRVPSGAGPDQQRDGSSPSACSPRWCSPTCSTGRSRRRVHALDWASWCGSRNSACCRSCCCSR